MTFKEILDLPQGKTSRYVALVCLHELRESARRKAETILESEHDITPDEHLMVRWFRELAEHADRSMEQVNMHSQDTNPQLRTL